jgi:hypothetical protein
VTAATLEFQGYRLVNIFDEPGHPLRDAVVRFWTGEGILTSEQAHQRASDLVYVALDQHENVAGVSTVYIDDFRGPGERYYFYRLFIRPGDRVYGMMKYMTAVTRDYLRDRPGADKPLGVVVITENRKLMRPGIKREFRRIDFRSAGKTPQGLDIWISEFQ